MTYTDPGAYAKPWGFTVDMALAADTEMLEAVCEKSSEHWAGSLSDAANQAVTVPPDVLARYVGVYSGIYGGNRRTYEVSLSGGQLIAKIVGDADRGGPRRRWPRRRRAAAAGAAIPDGVRRPGTRVPVHCRRQGCGDGPRGDSHIRPLQVFTPAVTPPKQRDECGC